MSSSGDYKYCVIQTIIVRIIHFDNFKYSTLLTSAVLDLKVNLSNMFWTAIATYNLFSDPHLVVKAQLSTLLNS